MAKDGGLNRNLSLEAVRVTEAAAVASVAWMGRGDEKAADQAAVDAMRQIYITDPAQVAPFVYQPAADIRIESGLIALAGVLLTALAVWEFNRES